VTIGDGDATRLASGPAGLFLITNNAGGSTGGQVQVRRFDDLSGNFTAPVTVGPSEAGVENDLAEAPAGGPAAGALFAVWELSSSDRLRVAASGDGGRTWLGPGDLLHENTVFGLRAGVAPDGRGFVVWDQNSDSGQVKAAPLVARDDTPPALGISKVGRAADGNPQWTISCPANEAFCQGAVSLTIPPSLAKGSAAAAKRVKIGSKAFRIAGGKTKKVKVKVNKKGRKVLKRRKKLRVTATFESTDKDGNKSKVDKIITLNQSAFRHS
jgi:hypothetical protein